VNSWRARLGASAHAVTELLEESHLAIAREQARMSQDQGPVSCGQACLERCERAPNEKEQVLPVTASTGSSVSAQHHAPLGSTAGRLSLHLLNERHLKTLDFNVESCGQLQRGVLEVTRVNHERQEGTLAGRAL
jgi:hypothetical protein